MAVRVVARTGIRPETSVQLHLDSSTVEPLRITDLFDNSKIDSLIRFMKVSCAATSSLLACELSSVQCAVCSVL